MFYGVLGTQCYVTWSPPFLLSLPLHSPPLPLLSSPPPSLFPPSLFPPSLFPPLSLPSLSPPLFSPISPPPLSVVSQDSECYTVLLEQIAPPEAGVDRSPLSVSTAYINYTCNLKPLRVVACSECMVPHEYSNSVNVQSRQCGCAPALDWVQIPGSWLRQCNI